MDRAVGEQSRVQDEWDCCLPQGWDCCLPQGQSDLLHFAAIRTHNSADVRIGNGPAALLYRRAMSSLRAHFEERVASLSDCAEVRCAVKDGATFLRLEPHSPQAARVVLYLIPGDHGTVGLDDPAAVPVELGEDVRLDMKAIDHVIDTAVEGRATAFHIGRGGCLEERIGDTVCRSWVGALPWPGWRRRARRLDYRPYR